jgi:hypothetical protein
VACLKNWRAFLVYGLAWSGFISLVGLAVSALFGSIGGANLASGALLPTLMLLGAMLFTSLYFTYADCFEADNPNPNSSEAQP